MYDIIISSTCSILLQLRPVGHEDSTWLFLSPMGVQLAEEKKI